MRHLFVAVLPPATVQAELGIIATGFEGMQWMNETNLYLTRRCIGETVLEQEDEFKEASARVGVEPFILTIDRCRSVPCSWLGKSSVGWRR